MVCLLYYPNNYYLNIIIISDFNKALVTFFAPTKNCKHIARHFPCKVRPRFFVINRGFVSQSESQKYNNLKVSSYLYYISQLLRAQ